MDNISGFITSNLIIDLSFCAWFFAQFAKLVIELLVHRKFDLTKLWSSGEMPSSHSALVCCASASIGAIHGTGSSIFALSFVLAGVVMYDACHVRRSAGEQARMINLLSNLLTKNKEEQYSALKDLQLKEILGHTPFQVFVGAMLGMITGLYGVAYFG
ncbi:MAG: divergent PAP2 family protein [Eubacteriales bacterium]